MPGEPNREPLLDLWALLCQSTQMRANKAQPKLRDVDHWISAAVLRSGRADDEHYRVASGDLTVSC